MITIKLKGREVPLSYTTLEMLTIQNEIGPLNNAINMTIGRNGEDKKDLSLWGTAEHLETLGKMVVILGNAGLREAGEEQDLTFEKVLSGIKPCDIGLVSNACMNALGEGMASEIPKEAEHGPVDVTLEEMNKKKEKDS